jgi:hypothetical protein
VDLLKAQLVVKTKELARARAQHSSAMSVVATNLRLNQRQPGSVSLEEVQKAESEAKAAEAQAEMVQAEIRVIELRLAQANRVRDHPERMKEYLDRMSPAGSPSDLERRLREVERKLDQVLKVLEASKRPEGR